MPTISTVLSGKGVKKGAASLDVEGQNATGLTGMARNTRAPVYPEIRGGPGSGLEMAC